MTAALNAKHEPIVRKPQAKKAVPQKVAPTNSVIEKQRKTGSKKGGEDESGAETEEGTDAEMELDSDEDEAIEEVEDGHLDVDAVGCAHTGRKKLHAMEATTAPAAPEPTRSGRIRKRPDAYDPLKDGTNDTTRRKKAYVRCEMDPKAPWTSLHCIYKSLLTHSLVGKQNASKLHGATISLKCYLVVVAMLAIALAYAC